MATSVAKMKPKSTTTAQKETLIRVLHVDDEQGLLKTTKQILEAIGPFQVESALSVKEAMQKLEEKEFDLVVSDYQMPGKNGLEFLRELRENENTIPFILFTGKGREEVAIKALNLGASVYCNKMGKPQTVYGELAYSIQQVFEKKKAEKALRRETELLEVVTQNVGAGLTLISKDYRIVWANQLLTQIFGEVRGKTCYQTYHHRNNVCPRCGVNEIFETGKERVVHKQEALGPDGQTVCLEIVATPIRDEKGNVTAVSEFAIDITERKKTEKALREAKNRFETYLSLARVIMVALDTTGTVTYANKKCCEILESKEEEIIGKNWFEFIPKRIRSQTETVFKKLIAGTVKPVEQYENPILTKHKEERIISWHNILLKDEKGKIIGTLSSGEDITEQKKIEQELKKSEERYRKQFEQALDAIFLADAETGIIVDCNRAATKLVGRKKSEIIGKHQRILHPPKETRGDFSRTFKQHLKEKEGQVLEAQVITKNGEIRDVAIKANIFEVGGKRFLQGIFRDITERKSMERALQESEEKYRRMIEEAPDLIVTIDEEGIVKSCNPELEIGTDYSQHEIVGKHFIETPLLHGIDPAYAQKLFKAIIEEKHPEPIELTWYLKDGTPRISEVRIGLMKKDGEIAGFTAVARDITDRKRAKENLEKSEKEKRALLDSMSELVIHQDLEHKILWVNRKAADSINMKAEQLKGRYCYEIWAESANPCNACPLEETVKTGKPQQGEMTTPDGRVWSISGYPLTDVEGKVTSVVEVVTNVTEQKKAEEALRESEEKYRELLNGMNDTAWVIDLDGKFIDVNDAAVRVLGYSREELLSMGPCDIDNSLTEEEIRGLIRGMPKDEIQVFETAHTTKDGKPIPVEISSSLVTYQGKQAILSIARDITERKQMEKALRESEERFRQVAENAAEWIWEVDADGLYTYASPAVEKLLGYKPEEIVGKKHFYDMFSPEDRENLKKAAFTAFKEKQSFREFINKHIHKNGDSVWLSTGGVPILDDEGNLLGYRGAGVDITDRKRAEDAVDNMFNELEKVIEKLRVVGKAARHDARNKLSVIANNVYLAKRCLADDHSALEYLGDIESAVGQIEDIFNFASTYEMVGVEERSYMDVEKSVKEAVILLSGLDGAKLVNECRGLTVLADSQLRQLFYNLIDNSLRHGENVTQIRVYYEVGKDELKLVYEDNGVGIPKHEKEKIFEEGYGKGTGYGLYLIQKICEAYGWAIQETGNQGEGARFMMSIPKINKNGKMNYQLQ